MSTTNVSLSYLRQKNKLMLENQKRFQSAFENKD